MYIPDHVLCTVLYFWCLVCHCQVVVTGYSDKLKVLLLKIVERMTKLEVNSMKFQMYLDMVCSSKYICTYMCVCRV